MPYGITVSQNGTLTMNGKPFYAYGINDYTLQALWTPSGDGYQYDVTFSVMKKYGIPMVRMSMMEPFSAIISRYDEDPEGVVDELLKKTDQVIKAAEKYQIGIIGSLYFGCDPVEGEKRMAWGDPNSKTLKTLKSIAYDVVQRYKDSPAIWGWEVSNEINLLADMPNPYDPGNAITSQEGQTMIREIAASIREADPYRMISTGDALHREHIYPLHQLTQNVGEDHLWDLIWGNSSTTEQFKQMVKYMTPQPANVVSFHMGCTAEDYVFMLQEEIFTAQEVMELYVEIAKESKQGLYFGEFGDCGPLTLEGKMEYVVQNFPRFLNNMVTAGIQLGTMWQFNGENAYISDEGLLSYMLNEVGKVNRQFRKQGLQDTSAAWPEK